jgi:hypothetical protein
VYQFVHIETFARVASRKERPTKKKDGATGAATSSTDPKGMDRYTTADGVKRGDKGNVSDVIGEALRDDGNCRHVDDPQAPTFLIGDADTVRALAVEIDEKCERVKASKGRAVRKDAHVLLAGVASFPESLQKAEPETYARWELLTLAWLQGKYGDNLRAVLRHDDETYPHLHFFVLSRDPMAYDAKALHDGHVAVAASGASSMTKEGGAVYNDAMRDFQSDYYAKVGHPCGLHRDGPKRVRKTRQQYKREQRENRERVALDSAVLAAQADMLDAAAAEFARQQRMGQEMATTMMAKAQERADGYMQTLKEQARKQNDERKRLEAEAQALEVWRAELEGKAQQIAAATAHLVTIKVPSAPAAAPVNEAMVPGANAPGSPGRPAWVPSATPSPFDKPPGF